MTDHQKQECIRLYKSGVLVNNIPKLIGSTKGSVERFIYKTMQLRARNHTHSMTDLNLIKRLRIQGKKEREILDLTGLKRSQLRYLLNYNGVGLKDFDYI